MRHLKLAVLTLSVLIIPLVNCQAADQPADPTIVSEKSIVTSSPNLLINITYPVFKFASVNNLVNQFVSDHIKEIYDDVKEAQDTITAPYSLDISAKLYRSGSILSLDLTTYFYTGGAHGMTANHIIIFSDSNGRIYKRKNIFIGNVLPAIRNQSRPLLLKALNSKQYALSCDVSKTPKAEDFECTWLFDGTKADWSNFSNFYFDSVNANWVFGQYQIAPFSAGIVEAQIPIGKLKKYIVPQFYRLLQTK